jgi:Tol biopolymer transport system component
MEPFVSRDGRYLLFNNLNQSPANTDIHFAERQDDFTWLYRGKVNGVNTPDLEGCPTMDREGRMFFVSPRNYAKTLCTIYTGRFKDGNVTGVQMVESISRKQPGIVNFDVDVSPDGKTLVFVDSRFTPGGGPQSAVLVIATWDGTQFVRSPASSRRLRLVNQHNALQYAPTISGDTLTLYFTRFDPHAGFPGPQIYRSTRPATDAPFGQPVHLAGLGDYVEGSALSPDERLLYFHRRDGKRFNLYAVRIR